MEDYSDFRKKGRQILTDNWTMAVIVTLVAAFFGALMVGSGTTIELEEDWLEYLPKELLQIYLWYVGIASVLSLVRFILGGTIGLGYAQYLLKLHDGEEANFHDLFSQFGRFGDGFLLSLLRAIFVFLWTLLLIIPGIVASYSYVMAPYIMLEHPELSPNECLKASKELMQGHKWEFFVLQLTFFGWSLLCALTLGIGNLWLNPYRNATHVAFYRHISCNDPMPDHPIIEEPWEA